MNLKVLLSRKDWKTFCVHLLKKFNNKNMENDFAAIIQKYFLFVLAGIALFLILGVAILLISLVL